MTLANLTRIQGTSDSSTVLLDELRKNRDPVVLTDHGRDVAVVVDVESYQDLLHELELLRDVHRGLADVEAGRTIGHGEVRTLLRERYPG